MEINIGKKVISAEIKALDLLKKSISLQKEVADLRLTYITTKSKLMGVYRRSTVEGLVEDQGLRTSLTPPEIIEK